MNHTPVPYGLALSGELALALFQAAAATARAAAQAAHPRKPHPRHRGRVLRPGADTPLWNELTAALRAQLTRRGDKAQLARLLGVPRQRVQDYLKAGSTCPDAERTLLLLCWVSARQQGRDLLA